MGGAASIEDSGQLSRGLESEASKGTRPGWAGPAAKSSPSRTLFCPSGCRISQKFPSSAGSLLQHVFFWGVLRDTALDFHIHASSLWTPPTWILLQVQATPRSPVLFPSENDREEEKGEGEREGEEGCEDSNEEEEKVKEYGKGEGKDVFTQCLATVSRSWLPSG